MRDTIHQWKHIFKLDPDKEISDQALTQLCLSGTDAIMIGGSSGVTFDNTIDLLSRVRRFELPCVCEVSEASAVVPGFDLYFIPVVLNARNGEWITGRHSDAVKQFGKMLPWHTLIPEGYIILNGESTVAAVTQAQTDLELQDVIAYAQVADKLFHLPICYIEYSGKYGKMDWVQQVRETLVGGAQLFYGGGIDGADKAREAMAAADTIVVGNIIYDHLERALETVITKELFQ